jgi:hypothetical protein
VGTPLKLLKKLNTNFSDLHELNFVVTKKSHQIDGIFFMLRI